MAFHDHPAPGRAAERGRRYTPGGQVMDGPSGGMSFSTRHQSQVVLQAAMDGWKRWKVLYRASPYY